MKRKKGLADKATTGTLMAAKYRTRCNRLADSQREKLNEEFLQLYYGVSARQPARRR